MHCTYIFILIQFNIIAPKNTTTILSVSFCADKLSGIGVNQILDFSLVSDLDLVPDLEV